MQVRCAKCGGAIALERDDAFLSCPFCGSTLYLDRAATFLRFELSAAVSQTRALDLLAQALEAREVPPQPVARVERLRLPFWAIRGSEATSTAPAFSPVPPSFAGFRLPTGRTALAQGEATDGFQAVESAETAASRWEAGGAPEGLGLTFVPFYRLQYGPAEGPFEAWVEAAGGEVLLGELPPSQTASISRRSMGALWLLLGLCALETALIPSVGVGLLVVAATAAAAVPLMRRAWKREGAP